MTLHAYGEGLGATHPDHRAQRGWMVGMKPGETLMSGMGQNYAPVVGHWMKRVTESQKT
ncbi:hypothetical protein PHLCEN_2v7132 [Hermanssonia centrifuga]|uniref:Uncharacterized protein n=1 Tax=Hermanssonia centrifuga TaxID=98765 RepID=A0A2R6NXF7_9APHY|nr:hypothetical protein PHLCEN_2v7132 [Hermanssonia centrifuga]